MFLFYFSRCLFVYFYLNVEYRRVRMYIRRQIKKTVEMWVLAQTTHIVGLNSHFAEYSFGDSSACQVSSKSVKRFLCGDSNLPTPIVLAIGLCNSLFYYRSHNRTIRVMQYHRNSTKWHEICQRNLGRYFNTTEIFHRNKSETSRGSLTRLSPLKMG